MENVLSAVVIIALILFTVLTLSGAVIDAPLTIHDAWQEMETRNLEQAGTRLEAVSAEVLSGGDVIDLILENTGTERLADYEDWDVFIQYYDVAGTYHMGRLAFITGEPINNQWGYRGPYLDAQAASDEVYEPGILNPSEQIVVRLRVSPPIDEAVPALISAATAGGVRIETQTEPQP